MPFFSENKCNYRLCKKKIRSLQVHSCQMTQTQTPPINPYSAVSHKTANLFHFSDKRVSHSISENTITEPIKQQENVQDKAKGSMTLEAVLVVPLFLFAVLNLYAAVGLITIHVKLETAMHQTGLSMSRMAYAYHKVAEGYDFLESETADIGFNLLYVSEKIKEIVGESSLDQTGIAGGAEGISFLHSSVTEPDILDLTAVYQTRMFFLPESFSSFWMVNRARLKKWTGYDNTASRSVYEEQIVYVAENGTVYHRFRECSHLRLSISQVMEEALPTRRNQNGMVYRACELCASDPADGYWYITEDGSRYHSTLNCGGLKRTVYEIPLSQAAGMAACSRCGGSF